MSALGLPLLITELTVHHEDVLARAEGYRNILKMLFSHPSVDSIVLFNYWDGAMADVETAITNGPNVTVRSTTCSVSTSVSGDLFFVAVNE